MSDTISFILKSTSGQMLASLGHILTLGRDHAAAHEIDEANFLGLRLYPDMFPLTKQVQIATDLAARGSARLSGAEMPSFPDEETTFDELIDRASKVNALVQSRDDGLLDADPMSMVSLEIPSGSLEFPKRVYLANFLLPNLYFHVTTAYALLRHGGVKIGKFDFLAQGKKPGS